MFMQDGHNESPVHRKNRPAPVFRKCIITVAAKKAVSAFEESITMQRVLPFKLAITMLLAACVTVNVYFPSAAAEKAADQIIDTVTRGKTGSAEPQDSGQQEGTTERSPQTSITPANARNTPVLLAALGQALEILIPAAHAQANNANLDISTPQIRAVTGSMQQRFSQLEKYFASGAIGLTADGLVEVRDQNAIPLAERAVVKRLVTEDNADRTTLYAEIAKANGHPEWEADIRKIFARRWVERGAQPGWYYQDASGNWARK
jgi:uncharacterized protein YdbL (DUF1318 family)